MFCYTDWVELDLHYGLGSSFYTIVLILMGINLIAMAPEMYLPLKKKYYHWKITQQLFKLKISQDLEEKKKIEKRKKAKTRHDLKMEQVRFADFEDFKRRFPTKREVELHREE